MAKITWQDVVQRCDAIPLSRAELARRCGLSESTVVKGMRRGSVLRGSTRKQVELVLALEEKLRGDAA